MKKIATATVMALALCVAGVYAQEPAPAAEKAAPAKAKKAGKKAGKKAKKAEKPADAPKAN